MEDLGLNNIERIIVILWFFILRPLLINHLLFIAAKRQRHLLLQNNWAGRGSVDSYHKQRWVFVNHGMECQVMKECCAKRAINKVSLV